MMMKKVLIIDEDLEVCRQIEYCLKDDTTEVYCATTIQSGLEYLASQQLTLVIMDLRLSEMDGLTVLKMLRRQYPVPILVLTANASKEEEIEALEAGADKFLGKPLDLEKCLAHAQAVMRRYMLSAQPGRAYILAVGNGIEIDVRGRRAFLMGQELALPRKQFEMLRYLADHIGEVVTKAQIYQQVWSEEYDLNADEALKTQIKKLRQKLDLYGGRGLIETIWGIGYRLNE